MGKKRWFIPKTASSKNCKTVTANNSSMQTISAAGWWVEDESQPEGVDPTLTQPAPREKPLKGLKKIAECMGVSHDTAKRLSKPLQREGVFFRIKRGRPPNRRVWIMAYPSKVMAYREKLSKQKK